MNQEISKLAIFQKSEIRKTLHNDEWWFSVVDICTILVESKDLITGRKYWNKLSQRLKKEGSEAVTNCHQLKLKASDGKMRLTDCANTETLLRLIQSIPSKKAEPFKIWLAKVGNERIKEIENPELATKRTRELYKTKGYSNDWIEKRMRGIAIREELTDEWKKRGAKKGIECAILTAEISKATFGLTPSEYKNMKNLKKENLRDHMTDLELIFSMLGERATKEITENNDSEGFNELKKDAHDGGKIAGDAKKALELKTGKKVSTNQNFLTDTKKIK